MTTGMVIMRPTSIVVAGGGTETASIRAAGGVEFANATSLSLNGVFTSDYDDYMIVIRAEGTSAGQYYIRMRASGSDNSTANSYTRQYIEANNTSIGAGRQTTDFASFTYTNTGENGITAYIYGPYLAQPTAYRTVTMSSADTVRVQDYAGTHNQSTAYDGITIYPQVGAITGQLAVYGLAQ